MPNFRRTSVGKDSWFSEVEVSQPEKHDPISAAATFVYRISRVTKVWETFSRFISAVSIP